jgi:hypothetical protein
MEGKSSNHGKVTEKKKAQRFHRILESIFYTLIYRIVIEEALHNSLLFRYDTTSRQDYLCYSFLVMTRL